MPILILISAFLEGVSLTLIQGYLPLYVRESLGETRFLTVGLVLVVPALGTMLASNFWGGLTDVSGRLKPMILVGLAGYVVALVGIPFFRSGTAILLYVGGAALLYGCLAPLLKAYGTLAKPDRPQYVLAYIMMAQSVGWLIGGFEGGHLMEAGIGPGLHVALWIAASLMAIHLGVTAALLRERPRPPLPPRAPGGWVERLAEDLTALYENPRLLRLCIAAFFLFAGNFTVWGFFTVFFVEHMGADVHTLRFTLALSAVTGIVMFAFIGPLVKRFGARRTLASGATLYCGMYLGLALSHDRMVSALIFALPLYGLTNVSANTLATEYSTATQRGGGLGVLNGTLALATIAGPTAGGAAADAWGLGAVPWVGLGFVTVAAPLAWWIAARGVVSATPVAAALAAPALSTAEEGRRNAD